MLNFIKQELRAYPELDTIRFIAVSLVVLHHLFFTSNPVFSWMKEHGWIGVDIFFTLSGFLITSILLKTWSKHISLKLFWLKRIFRLWPSWLLALGISSGLVFLLGRNNSAIAESLSTKWWHYFLHFANYSHAYFGKLHTLFSHFWSLSVEEHFYLLWPLFLLLIIRKKVQAHWVFLFFIITPYLLRVWQSSIGMEQITLTFSTHTRFDALAYYFDRLPRLRWQVEIVLTVIMVMIFTYSPIITKDTSLNPWLGQLGFSMTSIATMIMIWIAMQGGQYGMRKILQLPFLSYLGIFSYGVYLFHFHTNFILFWALKHFHLDLSQLVIALLSFSICYLPAIATYYLIDKPIHSWVKIKFRIKTDALN